MEATDFIPGWSLTQVLGEWAFGEFKLLVNEQDGEVCAMKEVRHPSRDISCCQRRPPSVEQSQLSAAAHAQTARRHTWPPAPV
jgi:hypothetical protein